MNPPCAVAKVEGWSKQLGLERSCGTQLTGTIWLSCDSPKREFRLIFYPSAFGIIGAIVFPPPGHFSRRPSGSDSAAAGEARKNYGSIRISYA